MCVGTLFNGNYRYFDIEHSGLPYNRAIEELSYLLNKAKLIVGFNLKYDLHWLRKYCPAVFPLGTQRVYCTQLGEFLLSHQRLPYPDLNSTLSYYGLPAKLDLIKSEYWANGRDTSEVPVELLQEYVKRDVEYLPAIFAAQQLRFTNVPLIELQCDDLIVLEEMEYNGMLFDVDQSLHDALLVEEELKEVIDKFKELIPQSEHINLDSPFHVSALLYGGEVKFKQRVSTSRVLKSGTIKYGEKTGIGVISLPRLVKPLSKTELKTPGYWSTDEPTLKSLRASGVGRLLIKLLLKQSELSKKISTYFRGVPELIKKMQWENNLIHGQFNQCVARTGRLSSKEPNLQNFDSNMKHLFLSRFPCQSLTPTQNNSNG
jgi:DNA polymerase I-like protein with 3'-5' exonuclease and polymerase domains